jgi:crossover junction endodeoxyribonuclease RusA
MMIVELPWPPKELSPNARVHWGEKSRFAKKYRRDCFLLAKIANVRIDWDGDIHLFIDFYRPAKRNHDRDNLVSQIKSGLDGMADAMGINDVRFLIHPFIKDETASGGKIIIKICK